MEENSGMGNQFRVSALLSRIKQYYDVIPPSTLGINRDKFNEVLMETQELLSENEKRHSNRVQEKTNELRLFKKEQELKVRDWKDRYDKLFFRWKEVLRQLDRLQKDTEKIRVHRDKLLLSQTTQKDYSTFENETERRKKERRRLKKYFIEEVLFELMNQITTLFNCQMGSVFVATKRRKFLTTLVCINNIQSKQEQLNVKIEIPSNKGIAGYVFRHREAVNVLNPYQDKRFYRKVDRELGTTTKVLLCFPLLETLSNEAMGVIQVLNKKDNDPFNLRDEERMEEYCGLFSILLEASSWLFKHEYKPDAFNLRPSSAKSSTSKTSTDHPTNQVGTAGAGRKEIKMVRIGKDSSGKVTSVGDMASIRSLVPKKVEDFVLKLNQCWKRAVKQASDLQNEKELLKKDLEHHEKILVVLKTEVKSFKKALEETTEKLRTQMEDFKDKRKGWNEEKLKISRELKKCRDRLAQLSLPTKAAGGMTGLRQVRMWNQSGGMSHEEAARKRRHSRYSVGSPMMRPVMPLIGSPPAHRMMGNSLAVDSGANSRLKRHSVADPETISRNRKKSGGTGARSPILRKKERGEGRSCAVCNARKPLEIPRFPDVFELSFMSAPCSMILLTNKYRIWRVNRKFGELLKVEDHDLIGLLFSDLAVGVDADSLPKLLKFDVVQGLGICLPGSKIVLKVTMQISVVGIEGTKMMNINKKIIKAPMYNLVFYKIKK